MLALETPFTCLPKEAVSLLLVRFRDCILNVTKLHAFCVMFRKMSETPRLAFKTNSMFALKMPSCLDFMLAVAKRVVVPLTLRSSPGIAITPSIRLGCTLTTYVEPKDSVWVNN